MVSLIMRHVAVMLLVATFACAGSSRPQCTPGQPVVGPTEGAPDVVTPPPPRVIVWNDFTETAFEEAKLLDRPVFVYWYAPWCDWCKQMDTVVFTDWLVADLVSHEFVAIRVDVVADGPPGQLGTGPELIDAFAVKTVPAGFVVKHVHDAENRYWKSIDTFTGYQSPLQMSTWLSGAAALARTAKNSPND